MTRLLAARGSLRLYTLFAARRPVASVYGVVHRGKFLYYQSGYDPNWASRSVGLVLLARTVSDAFGEGLTDFDFLRGDEGYKADWARGERWTIQVRLWRGARGPWRRHFCPRDGQGGLAQTRFGRGAQDAARPACPGAGGGVAAAGSVQNPAGAMTACLPMHRLRSEGGWGWG